MDARYRASADLMADRPRRTAIYRDSSTEIPTVFVSFGGKKRTKRERARSREDSRLV